MLGDGDRETAVSLSDLASVLRLNGDLAGADTLLRQSLETNRITRGDDHPNTSTSLHDLALIAATRTCSVPKALCPLTSDCSSRSCALS